MLVPIRVAATMAVVAGLLWYRRRALARRHTAVALCDGRCATGTKSASPSTPTDAELPTCDVRETAMRREPSCTSVAPLSSDEDDVDGFLCVRLYDDEEEEGRARALRTRRAIVSSLGGEELFRAPAWWEVLSRRAVGAWCYDRALVRCDATDTLLTALSRMRVASTRCALLYSDAVGCGNLLGVVHTTDALRHVLRSTARGSDALCHAARCVLRQCVVAAAHATVGDVCALLCGGRRYVAVCTDAGGHQIVSPRALVAAALDASADAATLSWLGVLCVRDIDPVDVVTCAVTATAREAFERMAAYGIGTIVIVGDTGAACGVISTTDVLLLCDDARDVQRSDRLLALPVMEYVARSRRALGILRRRSPHSIVACSTDEPLHVVLRRMLDEGVHHSFVLDADRRPRSVLGFTDALRILHMARA